MSIYHRPVNYDNDSLPFGFSFLFFRVLLTRPCCPATYHTVQARLELEAILCSAFVAWSYRPSLLCCPYFLHIFICVRVSMHIMAGVWRSEGSFWDLVSLFPPSGFWDPNSTNLSGVAASIFPYQAHCHSQICFAVFVTGPGPHDTRHVFCHQTTSSSLYHMFIFF